MLNSNLARAKKRTDFLWHLHKKGDSAFFAMGGRDEHQGSAFHHSGGQHIKGCSGTFHSECGEQCHDSAFYEVRRNVNGRGGGDIDINDVRRGGGGDTFFVGITLLLYLFPIGSIRSNHQITDQWVFSSFQSATSCNSRSSAFSARGTTMK